MPRAVGSDLALQPQGPCATAAAAVALFVVVVSVLTVGLLVVAAGDQCGPVVEPPQQFELP